MGREPAKISRPQSEIDDKSCTKLSSHKQARPSGKEKRHTFKSKSGRGKQTPEKLGLGVVRALGRRREKAALNGWGQIQRKGDFLGRQRRLQRRALNDK